MAREHARILSRIWSDKDFTARSRDAQRAYMLLLSQRTLNHAGVVPLTLQRWANTSPVTSKNDVLKWLRELEEFRFIAVDLSTDEVLIRSFIRNDGIAKQPNMLKASLRLAREIESPNLRNILAEELEKLARTDATECAEAIRSEPLANPSGNPSGTPRDGLVEFTGEGVGVGEYVQVVGSTGSVKQTSTGELDDGFADFWAVYPRRVAKAAALKAWKSALKRKADPQSIIAGAKAYADSVAGKEMRFVAHAATWLNDCRYDDELPDESTTVNAKSAEVFVPLDAPDGLTDAEYAQWYADSMAEHEGRSR